MAYSKSIKSAIQIYLDEKQVTYLFDERTGSFHFQCPLSSCLKKTDIVIQVKENSYLIFASVEHRVHKDNLSAMAEFICRYNYKSPNSALILNYIDQSICFRNAVICDPDQPPTNRIIDDSISVLESLLTVHGGMIKKAIFNNNELEDAMYTARIRITGEAWDWLMTQYIPSRAIKERIVQALETYQYASNMPIDLPKCVELCSPILHKE